MPSELEQIRDQQRQTWDKFSAGWKKWDEQVLNWLAPVGQELIRSAALRDTSNVLDVAAGTGEPGLSAAALVPKGTVTVTDLSDRMLEVAADKAARRGIGNFRTKQCDAGALPFPDNSFDAVLCRFGFMFFPDVDTCVKEFVRVARPGARVCTAVWDVPDRNPWATTIMETISKYVDMPTPPPGSPGLFRCAAPGYMETAFRKGGLKDIAVKNVVGELNLKSAEEYWSLMTEVAAPVVAGLTKSDEQTRQKIEATVLDLVRKTSLDGKPRLPSSAITISGTK
ncbi:class I SAM-dependent methyltransferase [Bradyrhizobium sp. AUGA SZCCT0283]|uniref:class I SAM-dependent methyltransferase n=1 Tax=Bradyrhizobium sp. AUGA SZCCT0283 TaxID=2807671 RepID=UPI001BA881BB|nr:methyltransferase domain-containing protein [Bradyrhizobium sp. AUGA SZCCT0283]MBR1275987.1 methyltransferase domain-containing protein [Bradyrhizobium sp. AUGA SZCCT0283]